MKPDDAQLLELSGQRAAGIARTGRLRDANVPAAVLSLEGRLMRLLLGSLGNPPLRLTLWNGESVFTGEGDAVACIRIADRSALLRLFINPELHFGEAYCDGSIEVDGDLVKLLEVIYQGLDLASFRGRLPRLVKSLDRPRANSPSAARDNIHHHYDLGNEFYRLWLDREMLYTCAYFPTPEAPLDQAQVAKMDHVCRKLRLRPGDTVVEAGCGWGSLALHMATQYGARVQAFNISREQIAYARARACAMGADRFVEFIEDDYRNIGGRYDAFVSVGMLEHVGRDYHDELGRVINRCLARDGRGMLHSIGQDQPASLNAWIEKRIFPGAYPPTLREMLAIIEPHKLSVLDVENLRLHYALTLEHWLRRFEAAREQVTGMYDAGFVRSWRLYLAGSLAAFNTGKLQLFQVLFGRAASNDVAWTRAHLYGQRR